MMRRGVKNSTWMRWRIDAFQICKIIRTEDDCQNHHDCQISYIRMYVKVFKNCKDMEDHSIHLTWHCMHDHSMHLLNQVNWYVKCEMCYTDMLNVKCMGFNSITFRRQRRSTRGLSRMQKLWPARRNCWTSRILITSNFAVEINMLQDHFILGCVIHSPWKLMARFIAILLAEWP